MLPESHWESGWFNYAVRVQPQHTDYAGIVWHGTYLNWMEAARVECLRSSGVGFEELVAAGFNLPVVALSLRYHHSISMGENVAVMTRIAKPEKLRLNWEYEIRTTDRLCVTATVSLVAVDMSKGKILRVLPKVLEDSIDKITHSQSASMASANL